MSSSDFTVFWFNVVFWFYSFLVYCRLLIFQFSGLMSSSDSTIFWFNVVFWFYSFLVITLFSFQNSWGLYRGGLWHFPRGERINKLLGAKRRTPLRLPPPWNFNRNLVNFMSKPWTAGGGRWKVCQHDLDCYLIKIFIVSEKLAPPQVTFFILFLILSCTCAPNFSRGRPLFPLPHKPPLEDYFLQKSLPFQRLHPIFQYQGRFYPKCCLHIGR